MDGMPWLTSKANTRPDSASVTVQVVVQRRRPLRLVPRKREPDVADDPVTQRMAVASSASSARMSRSVTSA